jgi:hypothetical protein
MKIGFFLLENVSIFWSSKFWIRFSLGPDPDPRNADPQHWIDGCCYNYMLLLTSCLMLQFTNACLSLKKKPKIEKPVVYISDPLARQPLTLLIYLWYLNN